MTAHLIHNLNDQMTKWPEQEIHICLINTFTKLNLPPQKKKKINC